MIWTRFWLLGGKPPEAMFTVAHCRISNCHWASSLWRGRLFRALVELRFSWGPLFFLLISSILRAPLMTRVGSGTCTYNALILEAGRPRLDVVCSVTYATRVTLTLSARHGCSWRRVTHDWDCPVLKAPMKFLENTACCTWTVKRDAGVETCGSTAALIRKKKKMQQRKHSKP